MLHYKNNILSAEAFEIDSPDFILTLQTDTPECIYFGALTLTNKIIKTIQFVKFNNLFKARLSLVEEDLQYLSGSTFKLILSSSSFTKDSNLISFNFNVNKIKLTIKQEVSKDVLELKQSLSTLQTRIDTLSLGKLVPNVSITNKDFIQPGMTLVAVDKGNFTAAYPFADIIKIVNGQQAIDGVVEIDASMIKYNKERTIEEQFEAITNAIKSINSTLKTVIEEHKVLSEKVADLSIKLETHLDSGVI